MTPRQASMVFSINCFVAALLALWIAFSMGLPRPYWAMLTVYIVSQPLTGALRSKAFYRVIGTVVGGIAAVVIVPTFVNAPPLMALVIAGWVGLCLYVSLLDRTPRAYVFMLAGYTTAIIAFPSVTAPAAVFDTALSRVEEITLGILCATLVHTIVFPRDVGRVLGARIDGFIQDGQAWIGDALTWGRGSGQQGERRRLAADVTELHVVATHLPFDTGSLPQRVGAVRALEHRLAYMLPLIAAVEDRLNQLGRPNAALSRLLTDVVAWAKDGRAGDADALQDRCRLLTPAIRAGSGWKALLTVNILVRLEELIQALQDSRDLASMIGGGSPQIDARLQGMVRAPQRRRLHLDHGIAVLSGVSLIVATLFCCTLWIATGWPEGAVAATMAAVFASFFAAQDDPAPAIGSFLLWTVLAVPIGALYLFAILPGLDGFPMLALALAQALLLIGYFQAWPRWTVRAQAFLLGFAGGLALQSSFSASLPDFLNANMAQVVGIVAALVSTQLLRSFSAGWAARRILRRVWRDIAGLARRRRPIDAESWSSLMLDRVGLVSTRIALAEPGEGMDAHDALADMRIGLNLIDLNGLLQRSGGQAAETVEATLQAVAERFERRLAGDVRSADPSLLRAIDRSITGLAAAGDTDPRQAGFAALVGLRRGLFPEAAAYRPRAA